MGGFRIPLGGSEQAHAATRVKRSGIFPPLEWTGTFEEGVSRVKLYRRLAILCAASFFVFAMFLDDIIGSLLAGILGFAMLIAAVGLYLQSARLESALKLSYARPIIEEVVSEMLDDGAYDPDGSRMVSVVREHNVGIPKGHMEDVMVSDMIEGVYKGMPVAFCDCDVSYTTTDSDGDTHTHTVFAGTFCVTQHKAALDAPVRILRTRDRKGNKPISGWRGDERVMLDDPEFESRFAVFSSSPTSAYYVLTPKLMEDIGALADTLDIMSGRNRANVMLFFEEGGNVYAALGHGKDLFELDVKRDLNEDALADKMRSEFSSVLSLLDAIYAFNGERERGSTPVSDDVSSDGDEN